MRKLYCLLFLLLCIPTGAQAGGCWSGIDAGIADVASIYATRGTKRVKVRIHGISVPDSIKDRCLYELYSLVKGRKVRVCSVKSPDFSSDIFVLHGYEKNIAHELVSKGYARATVEKYKSIEKKAQEKRRGMWAAKP